MATVIPKPEKTLFPHNKELWTMSCLRALLCIILPPLAVLDKGMGNIILVTVLTIVGWVPGVIAALVVCNKSPEAPSR